MLAARTAEGLLLPQSRSQTHPSVGHILPHPSAEKTAGSGMGHVGGPGL